MIEDGIWRSEKVQQFREADADGYIGMRGYLSYFQDAAGGFMHEYGWGNATIHERFGAAWIYAKYRMHVYERADYDEPLNMECWIEKKRHAAAVTHDVEITKGGRRMAEGRLESCIIDLHSGRVARLDVIGYDREKHAVDRRNGVSDFTRIPMKTEGMREIYRTRVRYSDLDNNHHMTNLRYIPLLQDAFEPEEYEGRFLEDLEIHYRGQCYYGEELTVWREDEHETGPTDGSAALTESAAGTPEAPAVQTEAEAGMPDGSVSRESGKRTGDRKTATHRVLVTKEDGTVAVCARLGFRCD